MYGGEAMICPNCKRMIGIMALEDGVCPLCNGKL